MKQEITRRDRIFLRLFVIEGSVFLATRRSANLQRITSRRRTFLSLLFVRETIRLRRGDTEEGAEGKKELERQKFDEVNDEVNCVDWYERGS